MKPREASLTHEMLTEALDYDPETGVFRWKIDRGTHTKAGNIAGTINRGYGQLCINKKLFASHRVAWFYVHRRWPVAELDHINLVRTDNRIENLREVTKKENNRNVRIKKHNTTGYKGVCRSANGKRFTAYITVDYETNYLGTFDTEEEAHAAYVAASKQHHGEFGRAT